MNDPLLASALRTVAESCHVARRVQDRLDRVRKVTKDDRSPVTVADFAVQAIVAMDLRADDPHALIVGEEQTDMLRDADHATVLDEVVEAVRAVHPDAEKDGVLDAIDHCDHDAGGGAYWALDPVDGTKGFLRGQQYAIALGLVRNGQVVLGVMGCPNLPADPTRPIDVADRTGVIYAAVAGRGAWRYDAADPEAEPTPITCAEFDADHPVRICESVEAAHSKQSDTQRILERLGWTSAPVRLDSQCKYAVVARGQADAYLRLPTRRDYVERIWDHAAGMLIATEAGAVVSDISGRALDFGHGRRLETNRGVVCACAGLHERLVEAIDGLGIGAAV